MNARTLTVFALTLVACDAPRAPQRSNAAPDVRPAPRVDPPPPADRVVVRTVLSYYHWLRSDLPPPGSSEPGVEHGRVDVSLVLEVHKNPRNEGWITVAAIGPNVDIPENLHLRAVGATAQWHLPREGFNDLRREAFGGELRTDEPVRAYLAAQPERVVELRLDASGAGARLPVEGTLPATARASAGQYDAYLVVVLPMRNRRGGRYVLQVFDMAAQPGGFGQNGVIDHLPTRVDIERYIAWMRDPQGMGRNRPPPVAALPIDRS